MYVEYHVYKVPAEDKLSDTQELALHTVVSSHVSAGIEPGSSWRAASVLNLWGIPLANKYFF